MADDLRAGPRRALGASPASSAHEGKDQRQGEVNAKGHRRREDQEEQGVREEGREVRIPEERLVHNINRYGNTTAATIPLLMAEAEESGRLEPGMKVACVAFGSGFTWGAAIVDW